MKDAPRQLEALIAVADIFTRERRGATLREVLTVLGRQSAERMALRRAVSRGWVVRDDAGLFAPTRHGWAQLAEDT